MAEIIEIHDFSAVELDIYARLTENQLISRRNLEEGLFIAESPKVIDRALDAGYTPVSLLMEKRHVETQARDIIARCGDVPVYVSTMDVLTQLTGFKLTRGVLCAMRRRPLPAVEDLCRDARRIALCEDIMNPTNLGAIFRSAAALNMDAVLLTGACCDPLYRRCIRVSMGNVFQIPWTYINFEAADWPEKGMERLRRLGYKTVAMALKDNALSIRDPRLAAEEKLAVLLGTEGEGLGNATLNLCDYIVKIPMSHGVDSLNVAAASAVAFWELANN